MRVETQETFRDTTMQDEPVDFESVAGVKYNSVALDTTTQDEPVDFESLFFGRYVVVGDEVVNEVTEEGLSFPGDVVVRLTHTPEQWQRPETEPEPWRGVFTPTYTPKVSFSEQTEEQSDEFIPRTVLTKRLWELRQKIVASGRHLLDWDDLENELSERRGEKNPGEES